MNIARGNGSVLRRRVFIHSSHILFQRRVIEKKFLLAAAGAALIAAPASAAVVTLTFEGIGNLNPVGNFYAPN